jgi:hypothetical protein
MKVNISNKALETGFFMREIGIFVEDPENADNEILYSVMNAGDEGDFLPRFGNIPVEIILEIFAVVGEAEHIEVVINDTLIYVLRDEFNRKFDEIQNRVIINDMEIVRLSEKTNDLNNQLTTSDEDARRLIMELQLKLKILEKNNIGFYDVFKTLEDVDQEQTTAEYSIENQNYTFDNTGNEKVTMKRQLYTAFDKIILEAHVSKVNQLISDGAFDNVETIKVFSGKNIIAGDKVLINGNVYSIVNVEAV